MERVFWLLLGRDSASVKNIMEEFQQSQRHYLSENHRRLVPIVQHLLHLLYPGMLYRLHVVRSHSLYTTFDVSFCFTPSCHRFYQLEQ